MAGDLPNRWHAAGFSAALAAAERVASRAARGPADAPPLGFSVVKDRPMRVVLRGALARDDRGAGAGEVPVYVKVRRARASSAVTRALRGARGPAEGRVLLRLRERGVAVPDVLGWSAKPSATGHDAAGHDAARRATAGRDAEGPAAAGFAREALATDGLDVLVLAAIPDAVDLHTWAARPRSRRERLGVAQDVGRLLRRAHDAGWIDRDFHRGNLLVTPSGVVLVDAGTRIRRRPLSRARRVAGLAVAAHGLAADARLGLAALRAYSSGDRAAARAWAAAVVPAAKQVARSYRRGRARRPTRSGLHFEVFRPATGVYAVRSTDATAPALRDEVPALLAGRVEDARPLKDDGSVVAIAWPGGARNGHGEREAVVKRYDATLRDRFRTPRAVRAFRRAYGLRIRGVSCPEPLLAAVDATGAGVYVAAHVGPPGSRGSLVLDLDAALRPRGERGGRGGPETAAFAALSRRERRATLHRLGRFLRRMHDAEVSHRDLKAPNLVAWTLTDLGPDAAKTVHFSIVDLEGARTRRHPVGWRRRARDLARLDASVGPEVSRSDRLRVLHGYFASFERGPMPLFQFARLVTKASARKSRRMRAAR